MNSLAPKRWLISATTEHGLVVAHDVEDYDIQTGDGPVRARWAVGCLVAPILDDLVLVPLGEHVKAYLLSVLERNTKSETTVTFKNNGLTRFCQLTST